MIVRKGLYQSDWTASMDTINVLLWGRLKIDGYGAGRTERSDSTQAVLYAIRQGRVKVD